MTVKKHKLWFDDELAGMLADKISDHRRDFSKDEFIKTIRTGVEPLELKDRVEFFADRLHERLGGSYLKVLPTLLAILGPENEEETGMFTNFYWVMPIAKYVEKYGLNHFGKSMHAMAEVTKRNTSEYAIRPYLEAEPERTLAQMNNWAKDDNLHIRRLASEGVRPRLPWASKIDLFIEQPELIVPILDQLKDDPSKYVQNSVANCINDIFKDNFDFARALIESWHGPDISSERRWIIRHALRKLRKDGDEWAKRLSKSV